MLDELRRHAQYEEYEGDHTNRCTSAIETSVLPFFSKQLSFDAKRSTH